MFDQVEDIEPSTPFTRELLQTRWRTGAQTGASKVNASCFRTGAQTGAWTV